jgi:hypothetical protein
MGKDPCPNTVKHFGACVVVDDEIHVYYACGEGQTINFGQLPTHAERSATAGAR